MFISSIWYYEFLLQLSHDTALNTGLKPKSWKSLSVCYWNLNSISSNNLIKNSLSTTHKFYVICLSDTHITSYTPLNEENLIIADYNLIRGDHSSNTKSGRVCIYCKERLYLKLHNINYFNEYIYFESVASNKICDFISLYKLPSQSCDKFEKFISNLDLPLETLVQRNLFQTIIIGDFCVRHEKLWYDDRATTERIKPYNKAF